MMKVIEKSENSNQGVKNMVRKQNFKCRASKRRRQEIFYQDYDGFGSDASELYFGGHYYYFAS